MNTTETTETRELGTTTLDGTTYAVTEDHLTWLTGPRGAVYFLRAYTNRASHFQVISWKTGKDLRKRGNEITVIRLGDVIEQYDENAGRAAAMASRTPA